MSCQPAAGKLMLCPQHAVPSVRTGPAAVEAPQAPHLPEDCKVGLIYDPGMELHVGPRECRFGMKSGQAIGESRCCSKKVGVCTL